MVDVSKLSLYAVVRSPVKVSKLSVYVPTITPVSITKLSMYAIIGDAVAKINAEFDFDFKIQQYFDYEFDWRLAIDATVYNDVSFDWGILGSTNADFNFDWKVLGEFAVDFAFDWKLALYADFTFDYKFDGFFVDFAFDWKIPFGKNFAFDWRVLLGQAFDFDWHIPFGVSFHFDWRVPFGRNFTFDYRFITQAEFNFDWTIGVPVIVGNYYVARLPEIPIVETWEYRTAVVASRNNTERRSCLRRFPRITLEHNYVIQDEIDYRLFVDYMLRQRSSNFYIARHTQAVFISTPAGFGDTAIFFDTSKSDFRDGDRAVLFNFGTEESYLLKVDTVHNNRIVLSDPLPTAVGPSHVIMPARLMYFADGQSLSMNAIDGSANMTFEDRTIRPLRRDGAGSGLVDTLDGLPLLTGRPLANSAISYAFDLGRDVIDLSPDIPAALRTYWDMPQEAFSYTVQFERSASLDYWREFADTVRGSWKTFLVPTYRADLDVVSFAGSTLTVVGNKDVDVYQYGAYRHLMIITDAGTQYVKTLGATVDGENTVLVLSNALNGTGVILASYLLKVRISDDKFTFTAFETYCELTLNLKAVLV